MARVRAASDRLSRAERRVAESVVADPRAVAFGTVADLAQRSGASGASVVRLAAKLGFDGFTEMQAIVQRDLARRLRPATERIRSPAPGDVLAETMHAALDAVEQSLLALDRPTFDRVVAALAEPDRNVWTIAGNASGGIVSQFATHLAMLRPGVRSLRGDPVSVARSLAEVGPGDVVVALDLARYDAWVADSVERCVARGAEVVALTDSPLSPIASGAASLVLVEANTVGPFDSYVGALAALDAVLAGVARAIGDAAVERLDAIESSWSSTQALTADDG